VLLSAVGRVRVQLQLQVNKAGAGTTKTGLETRRQVSWERPSAQRCSAEAEASNVRQVRQGNAGSRELAGCWPRVTSKVFLGSGLWAVGGHPCSPSRRGVAIA
jgi:hypothetical protein